MQRSVVGLVSHSMSESLACYLERQLASPLAHTTPYVEDSMGTFSAEVGVNNGNGGPTQHVEAMADTDTGFSIFPDAFLRERVGIKPKRDETFIFADGRERELPVGEAPLHHWRPGCGKSRGIRNGKRLPAGRCDSKGIEDDC